MSIELSVIIPTYNERENIQELVNKLEDALRGISWEVIFVDDDSPDETAKLVKQIAVDNPRVRCLQRIGRRGLSSACIEGMLACSASFIAVMDADLQHDESLLKKMFNLLQLEELDLVIGSRYVEGGNTGVWSKWRLIISRLATKVSRMIIKVDLKDPMSGFFMLTRPFFEKTMYHLTGKGFKILLDLCASSPEPIRFKELPYQFRPRWAGESKLDTLIVWEYFLLIADKLIGRFIPIRFVLFVMVGFAGATLHLITLGVFLKILSTSFVVAQSWATFLAMTINFIFDNTFTYRDRKLRKWRFFQGLLSFYAACSIGAYVNILIASFLYNHDIPWWFAGILGAIVGGVWNYVITATFTWQTKQS